MTLFDAICRTCGDDLEVEVDVMGRKVLWVEPCKTCLDASYASGLEEEEARQDAISFSCEQCGAALSFVDNGEEKYEVKPCEACVKASK